MFHQWPQGVDSRHVLMARPSSWVEAAKRDKEAQQVVSS